MKRNGKRGAPRPASDAGSALARLLRADPLNAPIDLATWTCCEKSHGPIAAGCPCACGNTDPRAAGNGVGIVSGSSSPSVSRAASPGKPSAAIEFQWFNASNEVRSIAIDVLMESDALAGAPFEKWAPPAREGNRRAEAPTEAARMLRELAEANLREGLPFAHEFLMRSSSVGAPLRYAEESSVDKWVSPPPTSATSMDCEDFPSRAALCAALRTLRKGMPGVAANMRAPYSGMNYMILDAFPPEALSPRGHVAADRPIDHGALGDKNKLMESLGRDIDRRIGEAVDRYHENIRPGPDPYRDRAPKDPARRAAGSLPVVPKPARLSRFDARRTEPSCKPGPGPTGATAAERAQAARRAFGRASQDAADHFVLRAPDAGPVDCYGSGETAAKRVF